jgi:hypothetical protein
MLGGFGASVSELASNATVVAKEHILYSVSNKISIPTYYFISLGPEPSFVSQRQAWPIRIL